MWERRCQRPYRNGTNWHKASLRRPPGHVSTNNAGGNIETGSKSVFSETSQEQRQHLEMGRKTNASPRPNDYAYEMSNLHRMGCLGHKTY